jgi:hypothetical protein
MLATLRPIERMVESSHYSFASILLIDDFLGCSSGSGV